MNKYGGCNHETKGFNLMNNGFGWIWMDLDGFGSICCSYFDAEHGDQPLFSNKHKIWRSWKSIHFGCMELMNAWKNTKHEEKLKMHPWRCWSQSTKMEPSNCGEWEDGSQHGFFEVHARLRVFKSERNHWGLGHCVQVTVESVDASGFTLVQRDPYTHSPMVCWSWIRSEVASPLSSSFFGFEIQNPMNKNSFRTHLSSSFSQYFPIFPQYFPNIFPYFPYISLMFPSCFQGGKRPGRRDLHLGGLLPGLLHFSQSPSRSRLCGVARAKRPFDV